MAATQPHAPVLAWLGGGIFVASLAYFVWTFFVRFGDVAPAGPLVPPLLFDFVLFSVFALHHSVLARSNVKQWLTRGVPSHLERSLYVWISSLLFIAVCAFWARLPGVVYHQSGPWAVPHWFAAGVGVWLTARSAGVIDPLDLAGIRQASASATTALPRFRVVGPYHWVRHPIYLGWLLIVFGVPYMTATRLAFAAISSAYLVVAIPFEEGSLVEMFGDEYRRYQLHVRWRLIPGVW